MIKQRLACVVIIFQLLSSCTKVDQLNAIDLDSESAPSTSNVVYISSNGNNSNSGASPEAPKKSIDTVISGKTYLLKRGDTLYFNIPKTPNATSAIEIADYGTGIAKPILSTFKKVKNTAWTNTGNVWKVNLKDTLAFTGFMNINQVDVGFIKVNEVIYGHKKFNQQTLTSQWDYFSDTQYLYVYSNQNLNSGGYKIEAACKNNIIDLSNNMTVKNIVLTGSGGHAIQGTRVSNVTLKNLDISEIGGSILAGYGSGTTRYGNGIEFWIGANNCLVEECKVSQVYDVAFTMQADANSVVSQFNNVVFKNNEAINNEQSFEFWVSSQKSGFVNCKFINNNCKNAGYGWSHAVRPNKNVAVHLLNYVWQVNASGLLIDNNLFEKAVSGYIYINDTYYQSQLFKSDNNQIKLDTGVPIEAFKQQFFIPDGGAFFLAKGLDEHSVFSVL
ncbi:right-handed parallel beta-helix repeat-containing protein [Pedobacter nyackensis]|uniref:Right handed beta helix region n=1 Tax=Pedobacter nyackensis TaxID=475255 RepID=A0A1W2AB72_9SPHI|nr:hypothetical protein [Pedobacter nyackensis]SMC57732.1 hypothetical protein SAMN04488101_101384 [Pedobacter nyackensis]